MFPFSEPHTSGPPKCFDTNEELGMIPRAVHQIFLAAASLKDKGWEYTMEASFLEIYNESIRDLLGNNDPSKKFDIKHGQTNNTTTVTDLTTSEHLLSYLSFSTTGHMLNPNQK